jgi:hypothetical protein
MFVFARVEINLCWHNQLSATESLQHHLSPGDQKALIGTAQQGAKKTA